MPGWLPLSRFLGRLTHEARRSPIPICAVRFDTNALRMPVTSMRRPLRWKLRMSAELTRSSSTLSAAQSSS